MGAWGSGSFENDMALDWVVELAETDDLSAVEAAINDVLSEEEYHDSDPACMALAACKVLAGLKGRPGKSSEDTWEVDPWVEAHRGTLDPPPELLERAAAAIDRILADDSELRDLWDEAEGVEWLAGVADLRKRLLA